MQEINVLTILDENTIILNTMLQGKMDINASLTFAQRFNVKRL